MPRGNRTGPTGQGPMTGRAAGYCAGFSTPGFANPAPRLGMGFRRGGIGFSGRGSGFSRGRGRGFGFGKGPGNFSQGMSSRGRLTPNASMVPQTRGFSRVGRGSIPQNLGIRSRSANKIW